MRRKRSNKPRGRKPAGKTKTIARVSITDLGGMGDGVATVDGETVFIPLSAPGDVLTVYVTGNRGELKSIEQESHHRAKAPCSYFGNCGGCSLQHLSPEFVDQWKHHKLNDALAKAGLEDTSIEKGISIAEGQRRRVSLSFVVASEKTVLGLKKRRSHKIENVEHCLLLSDALNKALAPLEEFTGTAFDSGMSGQVLVTECANGVAVDFSLSNTGPALEGPIKRVELSTKAAASSFARVSLDGELVFQSKPLFINFEELDVEFPIGGFLQPSKAGETALRTRVAQEVAKRAKPGTHIVDLFCGCGALSLPLARDYRLSAFDGSKAAIAALQATVRKSQGLKPVVTEARDLNERPVMAAELKKVSAVVLDPPRSGAAVQVQQLAKSQVSTVIYVSCNVATFARDCRTLTDAGFVLETVVPVDQFKHSAHLECVGVLNREASSKQTMLG